MLVTLKSNNAQYDLYKNVKVEIVMPNSLKVNVKNITQLNMQDQLQITNPRTYKNANGEQIISLELAGEQVEFANNINEGVQISITSDIEIEKSTPTTKANITMNYQNENRPNETFSTQADLKLNSKYGVLMVNKLSNYNNDGETLESVDDKVKKGKLDVNSASKDAKAEVAVVNNYETDITDIALIGKISGLNGTKINNETVKSTFEMNLKQAINVDGKSAKVYYSEDENLSKDSDKWTENISDLSNVKTFKIVPEDNKISTGETLKVSYDLQIPENLGNNERSVNELTLNYTYAGDAVNSNATQVLETEDLEAEEVIAETNTEKMLIELKGRTGGKTLTDGQEVNEGQGIKYILKLTNNSTEEIKNLNITATQTNAIFYDTKEYDDGWDSSTYEEGIKYTRIEENPDLTEKKLTIKSLKPGETTEISYQFSVKEVTGENETTSGKIKVSAEGLEDKEIETLTNKIKQAKLKLQMRNKLEEEYSISSNREYPFFLDVTNISDEVQKDIIVNLPVPDGFDFQTESIFESEEYEFVEYKNDIVTLKIPQLEKGKTTSIRLGFWINSMDINIEKKEYSFTYTATLENEEYYSNEMDRTIYNAEVDITAKQYGSIKKEEVEDKEKLTYTCEIENKSQTAKAISITDYLPGGVIKQNAKVQIYNIEDGKETLVKEEKLTGEVVSYDTMIEGKQKVILTIDTVIDAVQIFTKEITNKMSITSPLQEIACNDVTYKVKGKENIDNTDPEKTYSIQGVAWIDKNKNGLKEATEEKLKGINVIVIDEATGEIAKDTYQSSVMGQTDENGNYQFANLKPGKYMVVFQYDATKYRVTEYQKEGISEAENSDVVAKTINLQGEEKQVAITGTIEITDTNKENIDAGFIKAEKFDLKLEKYINKIIIQNSTGTTVQQYDKAKLAKVELDSKKMINSTVIIEYEIQITNEGELEGYANEIVDYYPTDLTFSSEMNKNWYQNTNNELCSKALSNEIIKPGESKTLTLTLMKNMTQNNTGTTINTAEINMASNNYSMQDIDSTPGNKVDGEDDMSTAEVIISIRTGSELIYITLIGIIIVAIGAGAYFINKKVLF